MKIRTVNLQIRGPMQSLMLCRQIEFLQNVAAVKKSENISLRLDGKLLQALRKTEFLHNSVAVCADLNAGANLTQFRACSKT